MRCTWRARLCGMRSSLKPEHLHSTSAEPESSVAFQHRQNALRHRSWPPTPVTRDDAGDADLSPAAMTTPTTTTTTTPIKSHLIIRPPFDMCTALRCRESFCYLFSRGNPQSVQVRIGVNRYLKW